MHQVGGFAISKSDKVGQVGVRALYLQLMNATGLTESSDISIPSHLSILCGSCDRYHSFLSVKGKPGKVK